MSVGGVGLVDAEQRARIVSEGLHDTLFVEAGAGTGKTRELVQRVVNLVVEGGVALRTIAAITFTEAAAAELRDRVREEFEKKLADPPKPTAGVRARCEAAIADLDQAAIGTLHGFCLRILGEHPLEVDLPPSVDILDEVASQLAFDERWRRFVDDLYECPETEELVLRAWALGIEIDGRTKWSSSFRDVAVAFEDSWDRLDAMRSRAPVPLTPIDVRPLAAAFAGVVAAKADNCNPDDTLFRRIEVIEATLPEVLAEPDPVRQLQLVAARAGGWRIGGGKGAKPKWGDVEAARVAVDAVSVAATDVVSMASAEVLRQLSLRLAHFTIDAAEQRRAVGHLVFHDLLVLARQLLRTSAEAREALHAKYERLLLDEFQDTDPIQVEVAVRIAAAVADGGGGADRHWSDIDTEPGRLFFVGDPKQSIYRFRRADISLFLAARDRFSGGDTVVLGQNFRTVEPVLEWVNSVFTSLMPVEVPAQQPAYAPLRAHRNADSGADHRVVLLGGPRTGRAGELRVEEATAVARTIASIAEEPEAWPVHDGKGGWRPPTWSDVTILIPTRTSLRQLEDALDLEAVPYRVATGSLVFDTQEVREALDALRAIDDPGDELALVSALRSPLYACSDADLFTWYSAGGRWDIRRRPPDDVPTDHPVARAMVHLGELADQRWWLEPSALLDRLLRERDAFALAAGTRRPREVWRRLRFIVDQARAYEESAGDGGLRGFLDWAELQRTEGSRVHEPMMAETDEEAVSILTIHGAKGLEFPITVVSGMTTRPSKGRRGPQVLWDEGDVPEVKYSSTTLTENFDRLADIEAEMDVHERLRLLYVACTRAQDHLVASAFHDPGKGSYGELVAGSGEASLERRRYVEAGDLEVPAVAAPVGSPVSTVALTLPFDDRDSWIARREALLAPHRQPRFRSATALAAEAASAPAQGDEVEVEVEVQGDAGDEPESARAEIPWRRGRAGTAIGRAVHATLQFVDDPSDEARIVELASRHAHVEAVPDAIETIVALVRSALRAPAVVAAGAAARSWRELYVAAGIGGRAVEGYVDLLYEAADGLVLVDYKTDAITTEADADAKVERYALQTAAYALAVEVSTGLSVVEARLIFCTTGDAIERVVPDLDGAKERVRAMLG